MLTFDINAPITVDDVVPIYAAILGPQKGPVEIALAGATSLAAAQAWLSSQQSTYRAAVKRSRGLVQKIDILTKVQFILPDLVKAAPEPIVPHG